MANLLVFLELVRPQAHLPGQAAGPLLPVSLEALGQARRVASSLGATLYALLPLPEAPAYGEDDVIACAARHGADKVVLLSDQAQETEPEVRYGTHSRALLAACEQFPPALLLLGATPGARDLAPRVAARLQAAYLPEGFLDVEDGCLHLRDGHGRTVLRTDEGAPLEHPVVLTVPPGRYQTARGDEEAEMLIVAAEGDGTGFVQVEHTLRAGAAVLGDSAEAAALREALGPAPPAPALLLAPGADGTIAVYPAPGPVGQPHYLLAAPPDKDQGPDQDQGRKATAAALAALLREPPEGGRE